MQTTPKSLRKQIGLFGRTNVGKSSFLNLMAGQDVAITSALPGTTTDVVEKPMELWPVGPVLFLDTAGIDDASPLSPERLKRTASIYKRADICVLVLEPDRLTEFEEAVAREAASRRLPLIAVINKIDVSAPTLAFINRVRALTSSLMCCSSTDAAGRERYLDEFSDLVSAALANEQAQPPLISDLVPAGGLVVLVVPIDLGAPQGRLILPQVQTIRDALDSDAAALIVKEREYAAALGNLNRTPDLVICDSQVVMKMVADTPQNVKCTTFSILFARLKGDLQELAAGAAAIDGLKSGDRVLIAEACTHHALADDIGRVKIPRWLRQYTGADLRIEVASGRDYPADLGSFRLIVHCGSCMLTRRETQERLREAKQAGTPITNYGLCISAAQGVLARVLEPFPAAMEAYRRKSRNPDVETRNKEEIHKSNPMQNASNPSQGMIV